MSTAQPVTEREVPAQIDFPEQLPVSERRADIEAAIRDHQVVILAGETGSGKTTQLPKICLNLGRGRQLRIGHTQPPVLPRAPWRSASPMNSTPRSET